MGSKKKKKLSSSEQCINIPEQKKRKNKAVTSYTLPQRIEDHTSAFWRTQNKKTTTSGIHRPRQAIWYSCQIQLSPTNITSIQISTRGVGPPRQKKKTTTTRELFFVNHQSLKQNRIRRQANQPRSLPTKDSTKKPNDHVAQVTHLGDKSEIHHIQHSGWIPHTIPSKESETSFWSQHKMQRQPT